MASSNPDKLEVVQIRHPTEGLCCVVCYHRHDIFQPAPMIYDGKSLCVAHYDDTIARMLTIGKGKTQAPNFVGMGEDEDPDAYDRERDRRMTD